MTNLQLIKKLLELPLDMEIYIQDYDCLSPLTDIIVMDVRDLPMCDHKGIVLR